MQEVTEILTCTTYPGLPLFCKLEGMLIVAMMVKSFTKFIALITL